MFHVHYSGRCFMLITQKCLMLISQKNVSCSVLKSVSCALLKKNFNQETLTLLRLFF